MSVCARIAVSADIQNNKYCRRRRSSQLCSVSGRRRVRYWKPQSERYKLTSSEIASTMTTTQQRVDSFHKPTFTPFSLIVDDVDARNTEDNDNQMLHKLLTDTTLDLRACSQYSKEQCDARIQQIKVEAESRKIEFARLLDEHAQVIRRLKHLEEDGAALAVSATHA